MSTNQKTIKAPFTVNGVGLHTGQAIEMTVKPAPVNFGYCFKRIDLEGQPEVPALVENVIDTARSTIIGIGDARIGTVEHVLSALYGMGVDNALIEVNGPETPILDGSARIYVENIVNVGLEEQDEERKYFVITKNIGYSDEENGIELMTFPDEDFSINVMIDYNSKFLRNQYATLLSLNDYKDEIANCRTFVFLRELELLFKNNLIKGGDIDNAIVIVDKKVTQEELDELTDLLGKPRLEVQSEGVLNNLTLHFSNEPARHKLLDLLGDLALVGMRIKGKILATRPGHASNVELAKKIRQEMKRKQKKNVAPLYDPNKPPVRDINQIMKTLPHRPPFLLIDKIIELSSTEVIGVKNITMNEPFFVGHFPEVPVMPGVLIVEAMAQVGGILVLGTVDDPENYLTYFLKIDKVKFRKQVIPGDTIIFRMELMAPIRRGIATMKAYAFVGDQVVSEGELTAQITKVK
jgi:UDP-3-O-[3-hydroxymyristoyl] N-acetylglucosamine deacetylase/3-hydroxyacyl-[acyl-carrier-protein] dehydratase